MSQQKIYKLSYDEMIIMRKHGVSLRAIGEVLGVSRERVRQIIGNTKDIKPRKKILTKEEKKEIRDKIRIEKFWNNVDVCGENDCWEWKAACNNITGYGHTSLGSSHRMAYKLKHGEIPAGMWILHSCDNPKCCNPAHLRAGTPQDNVDDREKRSNKEKHNKSNLYYKERNKEIYNSYCNGISIEFIANKYNLSKVQVYIIVRKYTKALA